MKLHPQNERIKHEYLAYLQEARQLSEHSIDAVLKSIERFEKYTRRRDFKAFHREQAIGFKKYLADQENARTGERLSKATVYSSFTALKTFFFWLAGQPGYKSKLEYGDSDYFNMSLKDTAIAKATREPRVPTVDQVRSTILSMPHGTLIEKRDRAIVAFCLLTGARDDAIASMRLKHVDIQEHGVFHDARDVRTKFSKSFPTYLIRQVGVDILQIFQEWHALLVREGYGPSDPLFPSTRIGLGADGNFAAVGLSRECWSSAARIRAIFKAAFERARLPYFNPHSLRKTLVRLGMEVCQSPAEFKAWSQNLGHEDVLMTFRSYGELPAFQQQNLIRSAGSMSADDKAALELGRKALAAARQTSGSVFATGRPIRVG